MYIITCPCPKLHAAINRLQRRHTERDGLSNHQRRDSLLNRLFGRRSNKTSKLRVTGLFETVTGEFPTQRVSNAENVSIWWRHHVDFAKNHNAYNVWSAYSGRGLVYDFIHKVDYTGAHKREIYCTSRVNWGFHDVISCRYLGITTGVIPE